MESTQGEMAEAVGQPCVTPKTKTLQSLQKAESEIESHQTRLIEAAEQPCVTPKAETLLPLQSSKPDREGIITEAGQPELESNQDRVNETGQPTTTETLLPPLQSTKSNQEGILAEADQPCEQSETRLDTAGNSDDADPPSTDDLRNESATEVPPDGAKALPEERENRPESITEEEDQPARTIVKEDDELVAIRKEDDENGEPEQSTSQEEGAKPESAKLLPEASKENKRESRPKDRDDTSRYKIFVIGKTGTGKSTLCNTIVGGEVFLTGRSFKKVTTETKEEAMELSGLNVIVVDTPDISDNEESTQIVEEWKKSTRGHNCMVVLAVRCDQRYSPAEYDVYRQIRDLWGHRDLCRRLVVAFTFADTREDPSVDMIEELKTVWPELKLVMEDAGGRFVLFDNKPGNTDTKAVKTLTDIMEQLHLQTEDGFWRKWTLRAISAVMFGGFFCVICGCVIYKVVMNGPRYFCVNLFEMLAKPMRWWWN